MVVSSRPVVDYYSVLQVHPDAEPEVIEAAYRQLMRKYHPDVAGANAELAASLHERAKEINQAYTVLRDPELRREYDGRRPVVGYKPAPPRPTTVRTDHTPNARPAHAAGADWTEAAVYEIADDVELSEEPSIGGPLRGPLAAMAAVYYMLPGPYEWEAGGREEATAIFLVPPLGLASWALASGRLEPLLGPSPAAYVFAWAVLALLALPAWRLLPRLALAIVPAALVFSGVLDPALAQAQVPAWLTWTVVSAAGLLLSARLFVFAVLPTLGICALLSRVV